MCNDPGLNLLEHPGGGGGTPKTFGYLGQAKLIPYLSPIYGK